MSVLSDVNVGKIMDDIKSTIKTNSDNEITLTEQNVVEVAEYRTKERIQMILNRNSEQAEKLKYLESLNLASNEVTSSDLNDLLQYNLRIANLSVDVQTNPKIETSKPKIVRWLVLKIRNIMQNEVRFALNPVVNNQIKFNIHMVRALNEIWNKIIEMEISRGYNELLKRDSSDEEINAFQKRIKFGGFDLNNFRNLLKNSVEYGNVLEEKKFQDLILIKKLIERRKYSNELEILKKKDKKNALYFVDFEKIVENILNPFAERHTEYLWVLKNITTEGNLLDIGSLESELANELTKIKSLRVFGVDIRSPNKGILYEFRKEDATHLSFNDEFFNLVTIISSIEHFGLDVYGGQKIDNADKIAIKEIKRIMKPNGLLLLTVPFGAKPRPWSRVYNIKSLQVLLEGFKILEEKYYVQQDFGWIETSKDIAELNEGAKFRSEEISSGAIACIMAVKS